jgi:hypothetical protein
MVMNSCHSGLESPLGSLDLELGHKPKGVYKKQNNAPSRLAPWPYPYTLEGWLWTFIRGQELPHSRV